MRQTSLQFLTTGFLSAVFALGCGGGKGPELATVTGTVLMNGDPVPGVNVIFIPEEGGSPSYGGTDPKGVYRLFFNQSRAGAELGLHRVLIESPEPKTDDSGRLIGERTALRVPARYRQPGVLSAEVSSGRNKFDFHLEAETRTASR